MYEIISGALMMACFVTGLFFIRFWQKSQDRLFLIFSFAFFLLSLERLALGYIGPANNELNPKIYCIRLAAFILILIAIVDKNRSSDKS